MLERLIEKYGEDFSWFEFPIDSIQKKKFEERLQIEINPEHPLYGLSKKFMAIAKSERNDDVLYFDNTNYYVIHLTWSSDNVDYPRYLTISADKVIEYLEKDYLLG